MFNSALTVSHEGIILKMDANFRDPLFKHGAGHDYKKFFLLFDTSQRSMLRQFFDIVFNTGKLQSTEFYNNSSFYQLKCIVTNPGEATCILTNNTRQRRQLTELEEQNLKALVNTFDDWVWSFDTNYTLVTANKAFFEARRLADKEELRIGDNIFKNIQGHTYEKWRPVYEKALKGEVFTFEEKRNNGLYEYFVEVYLSPVYNDSHEVIGCLGITRDITARKNAQHAIEGYAIKLEELAYKTSHDLRKPIANIIGMSNMLATGVINENEKAKTIDYIAESIKEVDTIVLSMLALIEQYKNSIPVYV
jgi:PAS domain S-box-containing protein